MVLNSGAQESLEEKVTLKPCETYDLNKVNTIADYQSAANSTETLEKIEDCMKIWIRQIEQVLLILIMTMSAMFVLSHWDHNLYCSSAMFCTDF